MDEKLDDSRVAEGYFPVSWELSIVSFYFFVSGLD
jgi:hypothetical protein